MINMQCSTKPYATHELLNFQFEHGEFLLVPAFDPLVIIVVLIAVGTLLYPESVILLFISPKMRKEST
jgi:hypothetical protein